MPDLLREQLQAALGAAYTLERELGGGGMARVFVAHDEPLGRDVVVKVLAPELAEGLSAERFAREVRLAARLQHPNIVPLLAAGASSGLPYYTMPYVEGESLRERLARGGALGLAEALSVLRDVARALAYAHERGVVHRDVKPENVLLSGDAAVVADFGIAKAVDAARAGPGGTARTQLGTAVGTVLGTPAYMAPEQAAGDPDVDARADVYAWGVVAYELLAGAHPFADRRSTRALITAHLIEVPAPLAVHGAAVPPALAALVTRCLAKDPADRPAHARELVDALAALGAVGAGAAASPTPAAPAPPSVAVLPFVNLGADPDTEYFSDGVAEEILNALVHDRGLRVAARTSAFAFKGRQADLHEIGRTLGVGAVVEGSVRRAGNRVRITAQLVDVAGGRTLWGEQFDRELTDIFAVQDEIAATVARTLRATLLGGGQPGDGQPGDGATGPPGRAHVPPVAAYEEHLRGRFHLLQHSDGIRQAFACLERAVALDPDYAEAHASLAHAYLMLTLFSAVPGHDAFPRVRAHVERALALAPDLAYAHCMLASVELWYDWDARAALARATHAVDLAPDTPLPHTIRAFVLTALRRHDDALAASARAVALDPLSAYFRTDRVILLVLARRYAAAAAEADALLALAPGASLAARWQGAALEYLGRTAEADAAIGRAVATSGRHPLMLNALAQFRRAHGDRAGAAAVIRELRDRAERAYVPPLALLTGMDAADADAWWEAAFVARDFWLVMLHVDPAYEQDAAGDPGRRARLARFIDRVGVARQA